MTFLRPWFLLLIFVPFILKLFREQMESASPWYKVIDEKLLPYLLIKGTNATAKRRRIFKIVLWSLFSIALAGPAWDKVEVPAETYQPGTVIVMELSPAMTGSNLERARQKIHDILDLLKGEQVGLVLYDRFGYTAGPLTFETDIIRDMIPYLEPGVLPERKSNPAAGFEQAEALLKNADITQGRILFLTSGLYLDKNWEEVVKNSSHKIGILGIGPKEAHPIPKEDGGFMTDKNGKPLMVHFDSKKLSQFGTFQTLTPDDRDIQILIDKTTPKESETARLAKEGINIWRDRGGMLVAFLLPFFALLFRKGMVLILLLFWILPAEASLWQRPDQEEYDRQTNAVSLYRRKNYEGAEKIFAKGLDIEALYNKGNALAQQQKIEEAIQTYKEVLSKEPTHADAKFNKEYLEKELEKQKQEEEQQQEQQEQQPEEQKQQPEEQEQQPEEQDQQPEEEEQKPEEEEQQPDEQEQQPEEQEQQPEEQEQQPEEQDQQPEEQEQQPEEQKQQPEEQEQQPEEQDQEQQKNRQENQPQAFEEKEGKEDVGLQSEEEQPIFDQESERILNQLPTDPNSVLRYRIHQQYNRRIGR